MSSPSQPSLPYGFLTAPALLRDDRERNRQGAYRLQGPLGNDVFQFSSMPWVWYTHISHTNSGKKENATPLFDWGRYFERNGRWLLSFSV